MRQVLVKVPGGHGEDVLTLAEEQGAVNLVQVEASDNEGAWDLVFINVSNHKVGPLLDSLGDVPETHITLIPMGVLTMTPSKSEVAQKIKNVHHRSPIEIWLSGLQSIGSWQSFLGYTVAASLVVWIGMFTNTIFLLVAAMLIAPFAGPAMNVAIATARGDKTLLWRNLLRYFTALALTIAITAALSLLLQLQVATGMMVDVSQISAVTVLLPLVAGAAGALNLVEADRNSLVSGTAVGLLVAAALAPPAGLIGMASALQRWDMVQSGIFLLLLQLLGINLAGSLVFRAYGLDPTGSRYERGQPAISYISIGLSAALLLGMLGWQFYSSPNLQRSSRSQQAASVVQAVITDSSLVQLVEVDLRFTRPSIPRQDTLLGVVYVQREPDVDLPDEQIRQQLTHDIQQELLAQGFNVTPLIDVNVLEQPPLP